MPAPAYSQTRSFWLMAERIATENAPSRLASIQPTGEAYQPRGTGSAWVM